jgi:hypothetical protein
VCVTRAGHIISRPIHIDFLAIGIKCINILNTDDSSGRRFDSNTQFLCHVNLLLLKMKEMHTDNLKYTRTMFVFVSDSLSPVNIADANLGYSLNRNGTYQSIDPVYKTDRCSKP